MYTITPTNQRAVFQSRDTNQPMRGEKCDPAGTMYTITQGYGCRAGDRADDNAHNTTSEDYPLPTRVT